jgi:hypothetical protein
MLYPPVGANAAMQHQSRQPPPLRSRGLNALRQWLGRLMRGMLQVFGYDWPLHCSEAQVQQKAAAGA